MRRRASILAGYAPGKHPVTVSTGFATVARGDACTRHTLRAAISKGVPVLVRYRKVGSHRRIATATYVVKPLSLRYRVLKMGLVLVLYAERLRGGARGLVSLPVANILAVEAATAQNTLSGVLTYRPPVGRDG